MADACPAATAHDRRLTPSFMLVPVIMTAYVCLVKIALDNLPTEIDLLHQLVRDLAGAVAGRDGALAASRVEIERLQSIIKQFLRAQFGRRSERLDPDQMAFGLEDLEADLVRAEARIPDPGSTEAAAGSQDKKPHRAALPAHLPRVETVLPVLHDSCPDCGGTLHDAGATSNEILDWIPAQVRVIRITRPKCACRVSTPP